MHDCSEKSQLYKEINDLLDSKDSIYISNNLKNILKYEIKNNKDKPDNECFEFYNKAKNSITKNKQQMMDKKEEETRKFKENVKLFYPTCDIAEIEKDLEKVKKKSTIYQEKIKLIRPDERTQRKAKLQNSIEANAKKMMFIEDALKYCKNIID